MLCGRISRSLCGLCAGVKLLLYIACAGCAGSTLFKWKSKKQIIEELLKSLSIYLCPILMVKSRVKILEQKGTVEELSGKRFDPGLVNPLVNSLLMQSVRERQNRFRVCMYSKVKKEECSLVIIPIYNLAYFMSVCVVVFCFLTQNLGL